MCIMYNWYNTRSCNWCVYCEVIFVWNQGETNDTSSAHSITLDNLSATGSPSPVAKTAPNRLEIVEFSESRAEPNTPVKVNSVPAKLRTSPRLPSAILKKPVECRGASGGDFECSEAEEFFTPTGDSALPPVFGDQRLAGVVEPLAEIDVSCSPERTRVVQYQIDRSPRHGQPSSSALTFENRSPRTRSALSQNQTIDASRNTDSACALRATESSSSSALTKKTLSVASSNSTLLSISSGASSAVASDAYPKEVCHSHCNIQGQYLWVCAVFFFSNLYFYSC